MIDEKTALVYAGSLLDLWLNTTQEDFPLDATKPPLEWIAPLGVPRTSYWATFESRDELWGRIRMLGQLLNAETLHGSADGVEVMVQL